MFIIRSSDFVRTRSSAIGGVEANAFSNSDLRRLDEAIDNAWRASAASPSSLLAPVADSSDAVGLTEDLCVFDHCGVLLFPRTLAAGIHQLLGQGLLPLPPVPSTVVRHRVSQRYGLDPDECNIHITRLRLDLPNGQRRPAVEVFLFPRASAGFGEHIVEAEATHGFEDHTAFVVTRPDPPLLEKLVSSWSSDADLVWEGGGHNPHEGGAAGSTVLYFVRRQAAPEARRRFELHCSGDVTAFAERIPIDAEAIHDIYATWTRHA